MDWVEEAPERELPERDDDSELGFTNLALGASASSLQTDGRQVSLTPRPSTSFDSLAMNPVETV